MYIFRKAYDYLQDLCFVWFEELKQLVKDEAVHRGEARIAHE